MATRRYDSARLGADGERRAARWYEARGFQVLARNWRCREGELDLVVRRGSLVVFCEVKTRSSNRFGTPFDAVGHDKQRRLRRLAAAWMREAAPSGVTDIRIDVAGVMGGRVEVIEGAV